MTAHHRRDPNLERMRGTNPLCSEEYRTSQIGALEVSPALRRLPDKEIYDMFGQAIFQVYREFTRAGGTEQIHPFAHTRPSQVVRGSRFPAFNRRISRGCE